MAAKSFPCPHCGEDVPARALACPGCGSDAESGWSEDADAWAGDMPTGYGEDDDLDYEELLREEGLAGGSQPSRRTVRRRRAATVAVLLVVALLLWMVMR